MLGWGRPSSQCCKGVGASPLHTTTGGRVGTHQHKHRGSTRRALMSWTGLLILRSYVVCIQIYKRLDVSFVTQNRSFYNCTFNNTTDCES